MLKRQSQFLECQAIERRSFEGFRLDLLLSHVEHSPQNLSAPLPSQKRFHVMPFQCCFAPEIYGRCRFCRHTKTSTVISLSSHLRATYSALKMSSQGANRHKRSKTSPYLPNSMEPCNGLNLTTMIEDRIYKQ